MSSHTQPPPKARSAFQTAKMVEFVSWFTWWRLLLLVLLMMVVSFPEVFFGGQVFIYRDAGIFNYPTHFYFRESILKGELPHWNPYNNCGIPFLAQWNVNALYPLSFLYVIFPVPWSITFLSLIHLLIAAAGMYFLAYRWTDNRLAASVAALVFTWNGITMHSTMWPNSCASYAWMPWTVLLMERAMREGGRFIIYAALIGALQMLAGVPEIILFTWIIVGGIFVLEVTRSVFPREVTLAPQGRGQGEGQSSELQPRRPNSLHVILRTLSAGLLVAGLSAAQVLPFLDFLQHSHRTTSYATDTWAMPPWGWANFFVPGFRTSPDFLGIFSQTEQLWTTSYYLGIATFALGALAAWRVRQPRIWLLIFFIAVGCIFALGKSGFVYDLVRKAIPFLGIMRYPSKWVQLPMFCLPLLAAFAVAWLQTQLTTEKSSASRDLLKISGVILAIVAFILFVASAKPREDEPPGIAWMNGITRFVLSMAVLFSLANAFSEHPLLSRRNMALVALVLLGIDLSFHLPTDFERAARTAAADGKPAKPTISRFPTISPKSYKAIDLPMRSLPKLGESRAMLTPDRVSIMRKAGYYEPVQDFFGKRVTLFMNCNIYDHVPKVDGLSSLYPKHIAEVADQIYIKGRFSETLADFLGASQISGRDLFDWTPRRNFLPLATIGQKPVFTSDEDSLESVFAPDFAPAEMVYLPKEAEAEIKTKQLVIGARVAPVEISANKLVYRAETKEPTLFVLSQTFYHHWKAYVNNQPVKIWRANHAFQAIELPVGEHEVRFVYEDTTFRLGAIISGSSLLICAGLWFLFRTKGVRKVETTVA